MNKEMNKYITYMHNNFCRYIRIYKHERSNLVGIAVRPIILKPALICNLEA